MNETDVIDLAAEVTDADLLPLVMADDLLRALYLDGQEAAALAWAWERCSG